MRTIVHISDLHFGRTDAAILPALRESIAAAKPDVVVVSGDLTQRAKTHEFAEARAFLDTLPRPQIVVPGNHDIPLYDVFRRWLAPLARFRKHITEDLQPFYADNEIAVLGINTARSLTFKDGRINQDQVSRACICFAQASQRAVRIVATHHPFAMDDRHGGATVGRARMAMEQFAQCGVDIVLSGHLHLSHTALSTARYATASRRTLLIQAGTATSLRLRDEANAFNILCVESGELEIQKWIWNAIANTFEPVVRDKYRQDPGGWTALSN